MDEKMKTIVSVAGRFHLFSLAAELLKRGQLERLITSYPKFETTKYGLPKSKVESILIKEALERGWRKLPEGWRSVFNIEYEILEIYDRLAARKLVPADIFVGLTSSSLHAIRKAKEMGMVGIAEHGSSHPEYQRDILTEEYEKYGVKRAGFDERIIRKELKCYEEADYISIPSIFVKRTFLEKGIPESKLIHVPYGVDLSAFHQVAKEDDKFRVVFAGGMSLRKGTHYLLQAFAELNLPNSELMLLGTLNKEMAPFFDRYAGTFRHVGHVPQRELYKYYSQGSVFVLPSLEEGLAMVQPQAMACGLPVIATTNTGGEDIIRDGVDGFIIPIRNVEKIKEKILYLYEHPEERNKMAISAKERVSSGFTWTDYGNRIVAAYEKTLKNKK